MPLGPSATGALLCALALGCGAHAGDPPALSVARASEPPRIDGDLGDAVWVEAPVIDGFVQVEPSEGEAATERTEVRVLHDAESLYFAIRCFSSAPSTIVARQMRRDGELSGDDHVAIVLDTFRDRRSGFIFIVGAAGGKRDGLITAGRTDYDWDAIWHAHARIDDLGWTAEIAIPTRSLAFDPRAEAWGLNIQRVIRARNEVLRWASPRRNSAIVQLGDAGDLAGISGLRQGYGVTIRPFAVLNLDTHDGGIAFDPSVDVFYRITPSITAALTVNTDFAEAEVDDRRVNLTRFPLFFPEKRGFFLEDAGVFRFGGIFMSPLPFFSRRIGNVGGTPQDILAGVKLTGRQGSLRFGLLDVQMQNDEALGDKNLLAGRATLDVLDEANIGIIFTNGNPSAPGQNSLVGADFNYRSSTALAGLLDDAVLEGGLWVQATRDDPADGPEESAVAFGGRISLTSEPWFFRLFADQVGHGFRPGLGFVTRPGERELAAAARYRLRPDDAHGFLRFVDIEAEGTMFTDLDGELNTLEATPLRMTAQSGAGDEASVALRVARERLIQPFEITPGVEIPTGTYNWASLRSELATSSSRPVGVSLSHEIGGFFSGTRQDVNAAVTYRPSASLEVSSGYQVSWVDLDEGSFDVQIASGRVGVQFSPDLTWSTIVQWDNRSELIGLNSRVRWEYEPGQELYFVYNAGFDADDALRTTTSEITVKAGWTIRF